MRRVLALLILMAWVPAVAVAHGVLDRTEPRAGVSLKAPPPQVKLWFTQRLEPAFSTAQVLEASGKRVDKSDAHVDAGDPTLLVVSVPPLAAGKYRVTWRVLSVDTHVTEGDFDFDVVP